MSSETLEMVVDSGRGAIRVQVQLAPLLTTPSVLLFIPSRKKLNWCVPTCTTHPRGNSSHTSVNLEIHPCLIVTDSSVS